MKLSDLPPLSYWFWLSQALAAVFWLVGSDVRISWPLVGEFQLGTLGGVLFVAGWLGFVAYWLGLRKLLAQPSSELPLLFSIWVGLFWISQGLGLALSFVGRKTLVVVPLLGEMRLGRLGDLFFLFGWVGFFGLIFNMRPKKRARPQPPQLFKGFGGEKRYGNRK